MIIFMMWDKSVDEAVRKEYYSLLWETVEENPSENSSGTGFVIGSSKLTPNKVSRLTKKLLELGIAGLVNFSEDQRPVEWNNADDPLLPNKEKSDVDKDVILNG